MKEELSLKNICSISLKRGDKELENRKIADINLEALWKNLSNLLNIKGR